MALMGGARESPTAFGGIAPLGPGIASPSIYALDNWDISLIRSIEVGLWYKSVETTVYELGGEAYLDPNLALFSWAQRHTPVWGGHARRPGGAHVGGLTSRWPLGPVVLVAVLACEGAALGQEPPAALSASAPAPSVGEPTVSRWYGWQTLFVDALPLTLFFNGGRGALRDSNVWFGLGTAYAFSGAILHVAHGSYGRAGLALTARALGTFVTNQLLLAQHCLRGEDGGEPSCHAETAALPMLGATGVDAGLLAHERVPAPPQGALWLAPMGRGLAVGGTW
jgi:hypothetical protein